MQEKGWGRWINCIKRFPRVWTTKFLSFWPFARGVLSGLWFWGWLRYVRLCGTARFLD